MATMAAGVSYAAEIPELDRPVPVAPGILWLRTRLPFALDHINLWILDDGDAWTLIDTGVGDAPTRLLWEGLLGGLLAGRPVARLLVTHFHPDHMGQAGWLAQATGARFLMARTEWLTGRMLALDDTPDFDRGWRQARRRSRARRGSGPGAPRARQSLSPQRRAAAGQLRAGRRRRRASGGRHELDRHHRRGACARAGDALFGGAADSHRGRSASPADHSGHRGLGQCSRCRPAGRLRGLARPLRPSAGRLPRPAIARTALSRSSPTDRRAEGSP